MNVDATRPLALKKNVTGENVNEYRLLTGKHTRRRQADDEQPEKLHARFLRPIPCPTPLYHIKERRESMEVHPKKRERGREGSHHPLSFGTDYENVKWNLQDCYRPRATSPDLIEKRMTKRGCRRSQTVSHRCVPRVRKYKEHVYMECRVRHVVL